MATLNLDVAEKFDITYRRNDSFVLTIEAKDSSNVDINFSGYTAKFQIKDALANTVLQTFTHSSGITLATGLITFNFGQLALNKQELIYDFQLTNGSGAVTTWLYGKLIEVEDVTT